MHFIMGVYILFVCSFHLCPLVAALGLLPRGRGGATLLGPPSSMFYVGVCPRWAPKIISFGGVAPAALPNLRNTLLPGLQASTILGQQQAGPGVFCTLCRQVDHTRAQCRWHVSSHQFPTQWLPLSPQFPGVETEATSVSRGIKVLVIFQLGSASIGTSALFANLRIIRLRIVPGCPNHPHTSHALGFDSSLR